MGPSRHNSYAGELALVLLLLIAAVASFSPLAAGVIVLVIFGAAFAKNNM